MNEREIFYKDKENNNIPPARITSREFEGASLKKIEELYGAADTLSILNAERHRRILWLLSAMGTLLTLAFLLYDEAEMHGLIIACGIMILCLFFVRRVAGRLECHRKYLQYRVLAECLRVQFYLSVAGAGTRVADILPWSVRKGIPWIEELLAEIPEDDTRERRPILDLWIREQKQYHRDALIKAELKERRDGRAAMIVPVVTIAVYFAALIFELFVYPRAAGGMNAGVVRAVLKIVLGTMSAVTLFTESYYGKMSLPNVIEDHKRMIALYETAEERVLREGESEELLLFLSRECLDENSTWYAYQSKNKPGMVM